MIFLAYPVQCVYYQYQGTPNYIRLLCTPGDMHIKSMHTSLCMYIYVCCKLSMYVCMYVGFDPMAIGLHVYSLY